MKVIKDHTDCNYVADTRDGFEEDKSRLDYAERLIIEWNENN